MPKTVSKNYTAFKFIVGIITGKLDKRKARGRQRDNYTNGLATWHNWTQT